MKTYKKQSNLCDCCNEEWVWRGPYLKGYVKLCNKHHEIFLNFKQGELKWKKNKRPILNAK